MQDFIKKNIKTLKPSATLAINEKAKKLSSQGKKVYNFGFGQSPFPIPEKIVSTLKNNAHKKDYLPMQGLNDLRHSISNYLSRDNQVYVCSGSKKLKKKFNKNIQFISPKRNLNNNFVSFLP